MKKPMTEVMKVIPISHGIAHQYAAYLSPCGKSDNIHFPQSKNGSAIDRQKMAFAPIVFIKSGRVSSPFDDFSAAKGNIVNTSVAARNAAISENRVAI